MSEYYCVMVDDVLRDSGSAILVVVEAEDDVLAHEESDEIWIPSSQIVESSEVTEEGDSGELHVTMWLAEERGW